jgi:hypothetical protein
MKRHLVRFFSFVFLFSFSIPCLGLKKALVETIFLRDYIVHRKNSTLLIINQKTLEVNQIINDTLPEFKYCKPVNNTLFFKGKDGNKSVSVSKCFNDSYPSWMLYLFVFVLIIVVLFLILFYSKKHKKVELSEKWVEIEKHSYYDRIIAFSGKTLRTYELDELFDIQKLSYDSRKLKRHRLIQEINKQHPKLINRIKDKEDQRKYLYFIGEGLN